RAARGSLWRVVGGWVLPLVAAFCYEAGAPYAAVLGAALGLAAAARRQLRQGLLLFALFASILPLYCAADRLDQLCHPHTQPDVTPAGVLAEARLGPTLPHAQRHALFPLFQPFFPSCPERSFNVRIHTPGRGTTRWRYRRAEGVLFVSWAVVLAVAGLALLHFARAVCEPQGRPALVFLVPLVGLFALQLGLVVLGRMNLRPGR